MGLPSAHLAGPFPWGGLAQAKKLVRKSKDCGIPLFRIFVASILLVDSS
jgi:hypothetical protein